MQFFLEALKIFAIEKQDNLSNLCEIPIAFIKKYNQALGNENLKTIYSKIKNIFIDENNNYNISIHPIIEVLSLCVLQEGISFLNNVNQLDNIIEGIQKKDYEDQDFKWKIRHAIQSSENFYKSKNNHKMAYIAMEKVELFQQQRQPNNYIVNLMQNN